MAMRCMVVRGLVKEVEEEINKFLSTHLVRVLHIAQSETRDRICVTLLFEDSNSVCSPRIDRDALRKDTRP
jgi:hypothetical protein